MAQRIQFRRDTKANWQSNNPILLEGEIGYVTDDKYLYKMGDGTHHWNDLAWQGFNGNVVQEGGTSEDAVMSQKAVSEYVSVSQNTATGGFDLNIGNDTKEGAIGNNEIFRTDGLDKVVFGEIARNITGILSTNGTLDTSYINAKTSDFISVVEGQKLQFTGSISNHLYRAGVCGYSSNTQASFVSVLSPSEDKIQGAIITIPSGINYIRVSATVNNISCVILYPPVVTTINSKFTTINDSISSINDNITTLQGGLKKVTDDVETIIGNVTGAQSNWLLLRNDFDIKQNQHFRFSIKNNAQFTRVILATASGTTAPRLFDKTITATNYEQEITAPSNITELYVYIESESNVNANWQVIQNIAFDVDKNKRNIVSLQSDVKNLQDDVNGINGIVTGAQSNWLSLGSDFDIASGEKFFFKIKCNIQFTRVILAIGSGTTAVRLFDKSITATEYEQEITAPSAITTLSVFVAASGNVTCNWLLKRHIANDIELTNIRLYNVENIVDSLKPKATPLRLFPMDNLPCVSFQFDDCVPEDVKVVNLFKEKNIRCGFAFIGGSYWINQFGKTYVDYQKEGFTILSHSINANVFNLDNYTYQTAMEAMFASRNNIEKIGMLCNGWVSPSSAMESTFMPILKMAYAYAFTTTTASATANGRNQDRCDLHRYSLETHTLAEIEQYIDDCITNDQIMTFYGHSYNIVDGDTSVFSLAKIGAVIDYCLAKRDSGLLYIGTTDECVKYFFNL